MEVPHERNKDQGEARLDGARAKGISRIESTKGES
jgi:hypothetical protein